MKHLRASGLSRWPVVGRLLAVWLLALLAGISSAPALLALLPEPSCNCGCPKSMNPCCCRRSAGHTDPGAPAWSASARCAGNCPCTRALPLRSQAPLAPASEHRFIQPLTVGALTSSASVTAPGNPWYLAFLYQRPPPWDML